MMVILALSVPILATRSQLTKPNKSVCKLGPVENWIAARIRLLFLPFQQKSCFENIVKRSISAAVWKVMIAFKQKVVKLQSLRGTYYFLAFVLFQLPTNNWGKKITRMSEVKNISKEAKLGHAIASPTH